MKNAHLYEPYFGTLIECSPATCGCGPECTNRLTPRDGLLAHRLEIYKDPVRQFCARTQEGYCIRRGGCWLAPHACLSPSTLTHLGEFVCCFTGEILPDEDDGRDRVLVEEYAMQVQCVSDA